MDSGTVLEVNQAIPMRPWMNETRAIRKTRFRGLCPGGVPDRSGNLEAVALAQNADGLAPAFLKVERGASQDERGPARAPPQNPVRLLA
jgi:hypothetical protein